MFAQSADAKDRGGVRTNSASKSHLHSLITQHTHHCCAADWTAFNGKIKWPLLKIFGWYLPKAIITLCSWLLIACEERASTEDHQFVLLLIDAMHRSFKITQVSFRDPLKLQDIRKLIYVASKTYIQIRKLYVY